MYSYNKNWKYATEEDRHYKITIHADIPQSASDIFSNSRIRFVLMQHVQKRLQYIQLPSFYLIFTWNT